MATQKTCLYLSWGYTWGLLQMCNAVFIRRFQRRKTGSDPGGNGFFDFWFFLTFFPHTGLLPSPLMIRTHLWLRGAWVGWRNFCLRSAFCHIRIIKHVYSRWWKAGGFLPFVSLYLLWLLQVLFIFLLVFFSPLLKFSVHLSIFVFSLPVPSLNLSSFISEEGRLFMSLITSILRN